MKTATARRHVAECLTVLRILGDDAATYRHLARHFRTLGQTQKAEVAESYAAGMEAEEGR